MLIYGVMKMCTSSPSVQTTPAAPITDTLSEGADRAANRQSDLRRRRRLLSAQNTAQGGMMQTPNLAPGANAKSLLGQ